MKQSSMCMYMTTEHQNMCGKGWSARRNGGTHNYSWQPRHPLSQMDRSSRQKITKDIVEFNSTTKRLELIVTYGAIHPTTAEHTFFFSWHGTFTKIAHVLGHREHLYKFERREIIWSLLPGHNRIKWVIRNMGIARKSQNIWRLSTHFWLTHGWNEKYQEKF